LTLQNRSLAIPIFSYFLPAASLAICFFPRSFLRSRAASSVFHSRAGSHRTIVGHEHSLAYGRHAQHLRPASLQPASAYGYRTSPICCFATNATRPIYYVQHIHDVDLWPPEYTRRRTLGPEYAAGQNTKETQPVLGPPTIKRLSAKSPT
jgi:hypothetical protein